MVFSLLLCGMTQAMKMDITAAGDPVVGFPDNGNWPAGEAPPLVIDDNVNTKYLHFDGHLQTTGFAVTPKYGGLVVNEITFTTANDSPHRDPVSFELHGSNDSIDGPWTLIASGDIVDFAQADPWPRFTKNATSITFDNDVVYAHYQVLFTAVRDPGANNFMQIAEVELLATLPPVPAGWVYKDIGTTGGAAWEAAGKINIRADGHDIWGNADGIGFLYRPMSGNGVLELNLVSMENWNTGGWSKAGPAIRETLEGGSKHAMMAMTGWNGLQFIWRPATNGGSSGTQRTGETWPELMRITREGNLLTGEFGYIWSPVDPPMWEVVDSRDVAMNEDVYIGIAVSSCAPGFLNHSIFDQVTLTAAPYYKAWELNPPDGSLGMSLTPTLTWRAGEGADEHQVLLGTDPAAMTLVATKALGDESYTPDTPLAENTTYYWQIVEQPGDYASAVMSFTTYYVPPWWTGTVLREIWTDTTGWTEVRHLTDHWRYILEPPNPNPVLTKELTVMDTPQFDPDWNNYGGRMTTHLVPATSGDYTFWVAADDGCELWMSTEAVCNPVKIAYWGGWTGYHAYDSHPEQMSAPISLVGGQKYLIQALWKEGGGGDHCSVAWEGPDAPSRTEIGGDYVSRAFAINPKPGIKANVTPLDAKTLNWTAGVYAAQQELYFGTDPGAMALIATLPADTTSYDAPAVALDTTYYWQVNEVNGTDLWEGDIWSYTVSEWVNLDIGRHDPAGSHAYDEVTGVHVINADGGDIWGEWDEFHYVYTTPTFTRDQGTIIARVVSLQRTNDWAKAGVMIRQSLAANSKYTCTMTTPEEWNQRATFQWRDCDGCGSGSSSVGPGVINPEWVKLVRNGNTFSGYHSDDGDNWIHLGDHYLEMNSDVYVGLGVTSHAGGAITTCLIDNLSITTPDPRQAWNLSPRDLAEGVNIHATLTWNAGDDAIQHLVYFSEDEDAVVNRTVEPTTLPAETTELYVGPLDLTKTYFWCVDEVSNPVTPGEVFSFTAENYRLLDDFESYAIAPEALPPQVMTPGEILVEAVPPPEGLEYIDPQVLDDGAVIVTDPDRGQVLALDGNGDYVDCGNPAALNFSTGDWSLSAWIKNTMSGTGDINKGSIIANGGDGSGGHRWGLVVSEQTEGKLTLVTDDNASKKQAKSATSVNNGAWHHVLGLREGAEIRIYIDGMHEATTGLPSAAYDLSGTSQANVLIGAITLASDGSIYKDYEGLIDDVRIYDSALSEDNIAYLAGTGGSEPDAGGLVGHWEFEADFNDTSGNGFDGTPQGYLAKPGYWSPTILHWDMDEGSGDTAADSSGNGLDGAISGAAWTTTTADGSDACLDFSGLGDYVVNELAGPYLNNLDALTISLWIQSDVIDTDKGFIIGRNPEGNDERGMRYDTVGASAGGDDVIKYGVATNEGAEQSESSENIQTTEWQHVLMTWQSGVGTTLYINGLYNDPNYDGATISGVTSGYTKLLVGKGGKDAAADAGWDGRIDDVWILDRVATEGEIRWLAGLGNIALPDRYTPMLLHLEFKGNLEDSSGNNRDGTAHGTGIGFETDPIMGEVLSLPGGDSNYVEVGEVGNYGNMPVSIACWAKADHTSIPDWTLVFGFSTPGGDCGSHFNIGSIGGPGGVGAHTWCMERTIFTDEQALDWRHYAMTWDGGTVRYYGDGLYVGEYTHGDNLSRRGDYVNVGKRNTQESSFPGKVDDARIYDYPLNLGQIRMLANYYPPNMITDVWSGRASTIPVMEWKLPAHGGAQSMRVEYTGSGAVTRLAPFDDGAHPHGWNADFSLGQAQAMSLWFRGNPGNAPGAMFAQLTTVVPSAHTQRVLYDGDPEDLLNPNWQEWTMSLLALSTGKPFDPPLPEEGLPITKIKDIGVGIIAAGGGTLYFDDFRLYPVRCVPKYGPAYDLTDDCVVDREDMAVIAQAWLAEEGGNGLWYEYFEGWWDVLPYFPSMPLITQGKADNFDIGVRERDDGFGFRFIGMVAAPVGGDYTFYLNSDDGSKLYIDGELVVDYDGLHGMGGPIEGTTNLMAGEHLIEVIMFENGGGEGLTVEVSGPGITSPIPIPNEVLFLAPGIPADLNGDGIVNFKDYADMLNHFGDELLFPAPEEQL